MSRPYNILRPTKLTLHLPEDIRAKLDLLLYSEIEGRIPKGAYQKFFVQLINEYFAKRDSHVKS